MEEHRFFGQKEIEKYLDEVFEHAIPMSSKKIEHALKFVGKEEYINPMLQNLDTLFSKGRYSAITEYTIEIWDDPDFLKAVNDVKIINSLTPEERLKLKYLRILLETAQPLFHRKPIKFSESLFFWIKGKFSIKNDLLMKEIGYGRYQHLSLMLLSSLVKAYWDDKKFVNSIALNQMSQVLDGVKYMQDKGKENLKHQLEMSSRTLWDIDNHMEIGKRMGLNKSAQFIYDAIDGFVCVRYYYNQVDAAKEFEKWLRKNWKGLDEVRKNEQFDEIHAVLESICKKHNVWTSKLDSAMNYIAFDLLHFTLIPDNPPKDDFDMAFDPNDPDFGD